VSRAFAQGIRFCPMCGSSNLAERVPERDDRERTTCLDCGFVRYVGPVLAAGVLVHDDQGRFCMLRRGHQPGKGKWAFPGGFVNVDEDPEQAALRETREEAGCECELEGLLGAYPSDGPLGKRVVILVYAGRMTRCTETECWEVQEMRWFRRDELDGLEFAFESTRAALGDFFRTRGGT